MQKRKKIPFLPVVHHLAVSSRVGPVLLRVVEMKGSIATILLCFWETTCPWAKGLLYFSQISFSIENVNGSIRALHIEL